MIRGVDARLGRTGLREALRAALRRRAGELLQRLEERDGALPDEGRPGRADEDPS